MAKKSSIEKNNRRARLAKQYAAKSARLKAIANDRDQPMQERFQAHAEDCRDAAQFVADALSQSLRRSRPAARVITAK